MMCTIGGGGDNRYFEMDWFELTKIIVSRIHRVEPENVMKIMGCIFLHQSNEEMRQLAFASETILLSKINEVKSMIGILSSKTGSSSSSSQIQSPELPYQLNSFLGARSFSSPATSHAPGSMWGLQLGSDRHASIDNHEFAPCSLDSILEEYSLRKQALLFNLDGQYFQDAALGGGVGVLTSRVARRTPSLPEFPIKPCHYFYKGYCKHGDNCRYFHGPATPDGYSQVFNGHANEFVNDDDLGFSPGSLEKLELEIMELLRSKRGAPVSIASLPMMYEERYGKNLQAEGYLTESQRHGKAGFSLTKLLARLKNIRLIDRPHGQHAVIPAEDASRYMECKNERSDGALTSSSHQIYLTFPAESTFTEEDVSNYFKQYGSVHDVRIPCQEKRMFGFVSFLSSDTVNIILMKRNPHYICGARVLVKPYREKSRPIDRTYMEKIKLSMCHSPRFLGMEPEILATSRESDSSRLIRKHFIEEQRMIEHERRRLSEFNIVQKPFAQQPYFGYCMEENKAQESDDFLMESHFSYIHEVLNSGSPSDDKARNTSSSLADQDISHIELPDSPFASPPPVTSSIFTLT